MSLSINAFPEEVLHHIFSFLRVPDRLNASLVCRQWLNVMKSKYLLRDIKVMIDIKKIIDQRDNYNIGIDQRDNDNIVPIFINMSRNFSHFAFTSVIVDSNYYPLFERFSHHVECLSFDNCETWRKEPGFFNLTYESLKSLIVIGCDLWSLFPSLPNLSELHLSGDCTMSDYGIAFLQKTMKHLKTLTLDCNIVINPKVYKRFYCRGLSYEEEPSSLILSLPSIKSFISERARTLKELKLGFAFSSKALQEITTLENLYLTKICLSNCSECEMSFPDLFKFQPSLKKVEFYNLKNLNNDFICSFIALLPNVEEVSFHSYYCVPDYPLSKFFHLKNLKKLHLGKNYGPYTTFLIVDEKIPAVHLQSLNLSKILLQNIDVLKQCKNLLHLDVSYCKLSDEEVHVITENLVHLQYLNLKANPITDYGLTGLKIDKQDLNQVNIDNIYEENQKSLSNLKQLQTVILEQCVKITQFGFIQAICFQYLEYLNIIGCCVTEHILEQLLSQNPSLRKICTEDNLMIMKTTSYAAY